MSPTTSLRPSRRMPWLATAAAVAVLGAGAVLFLRATSEPPALPGQVADVAPRPAAPADAIPERDLPRALRAVSGDPLFERALGPRDLARRWAGAVASLSLGESPRPWLGFLAPGRRFAAAARGDGHVVSPQAYARYDAFADAVASVDARALAAVYRGAHPVLDQAYRAFGHPDGLDQALARALERLLAAPVPEGEVELVRRGGAVSRWAFADPELERLTELDKHMLRLGPRNARLVQGKARELAGALGLSAVAAQRAR